MKNTFKTALYAGIVSMVMVVPESMIVPPLPVAWSIAKTLRSRGKG
jgi:hypothetical protein